MSDLISRQAVMEMLTSIELSHTVIPITEAKLGLKELPTAYDVDKVVEQPREKTLVKECDIGALVPASERVVILNDAINIINKGGKE